MRLFVIATLLLCACSSETKPPAETEPPAKTSCGHAHNDYEHPRPLQDALDASMCSVEVDVWLVGSDLLVAHLESETVPSRTLQSLYLDPLRDAQLDKPLMLLIDVKSDASSTYTVLHNILVGYSDILTQWDDDVVTERSVMAVVSGNRDRAAMEAQDTRYAAYDGRVGDLDDATPASTALMPLISDNWTLQVGWPGGEDEIPAENKQLLDGFVETTHAQGRILRFWGSPDVEEIWQVQSDAGVDLINTDDLGALQEFLNR